MGIFEKAVGQRIKRRRLERGYKTQADLARAIDPELDRSRVSRWETGENVPKKYRRKLLLALGATEDEIFGVEPPPLPESELSPGDAKILARLEALEKRLPNDFYHGKEAEIDNLKAQIRELRELIGPHARLLELLKSNERMSRAVYALAFPREESQSEAKKKTR